MSIPASGAATVAAALAPIGLALHCPSGLVWGAVAVGGFLTGAEVESEVRNRPAATAPQVWAPAARSSWRGPAVVRFTGWARDGGAGRWSAVAAIVATARGETTGAGSVPGRGDRVLLRGEGPAPEPGATADGLVTLEHPRRAGVPGAFDEARYLAGRRIRWRGRIDHPAIHRNEGRVARAGRVVANVRSAAIAELSRTLPPAEASLMASVLLADRTTESRIRSTPFAALGLAHLFAVSGLHVGILLGLALAIGRTAGVPSAVLAVFGAAALPVYAILVGVPASVVRAGGVGALALLAPVAGRRADPLHLLGLVYWCGVLVDPAGATDTGLRLSYMAAGGILVTGRLTDGFRFRARGPSKLAAASLGVSLAAQLATLPVVLTTFGRLHPLSPLINMIAVPAFGAAVWTVAGGLVLGSIWPWAGDSVVSWGWLLLRALAAAANAGDRALGGVGATLPTAGRFAVALSFVGAPAAWLALRRRRGGGLVPLSILAGSFAAVLVGLGALRASSPGGTAVEVWQFDVGQGDCASVAFPDGWSLLIDTGGSYGRRSSGGAVTRSVTPFLERAGRGRPDAAVLTHGHGDHTGGAADLAAKSPGTVWLCGGRASEAVAGAADVRTVRRDTVLHRWRDWDLVLLAPGAGPAAVLHENDRSLVAALRHRQRWVMCWTGDLERKGEAALLARDAVQPSPVWKAGHHGSATSGSRSFLDALRPRLVVVSCGVGNRYGHPSHGPFLARGDTSGIVRTDLHGSVHLSWPAGGGEARIRTMFGGSP